MKNRIECTWFAAFLGSLIIGGSGCEFAIGSEIPQPTDYDQGVGGCAEGVDCQESEGGILPQAPVDKPGRGGQGGEAGDQGGESDQGCADGGQGGQGGDPGGQGGDPGGQGGDLGGQGGSGGAAILCGDGILGGSEACDDRNMMDGDGCGAACAIEIGWSCGGAPSVCNTVCGDGIVAGAEACDDKNESDGDGCSGICTVESGWRCYGSPGVCQDIDECAAEISNCSVNATCTNSIGSFSCECKQGYMGDGFGCQCAPPFASCGGACVDTLTDMNNCGLCGNLCPPSGSCVSGTCVGSGNLELAITWSRPGDLNLIVATPTGNTIHYLNRGPNASTDFGQMDIDDASGQGPENIFWHDGTAPPVGIYHVCAETRSFSPPPSSADPVAYTLILKRPTYSEWNFMGRFESVTPSNGSCSPGLDSYITSFSYP